MTKLLKSYSGLVVTIIFSCAISVVLCFGRIFHSHSIMYGFLLWNLFLAFIPFVVGLYISYKSHYTNKWLIATAMSFWLLFFPNAPYIMTDFVHLHHRPPVPFWFDLMLLISFAWNGLLLGYISLLLIHETVQRLWNNTTAWLFSIGSLCLGAFGIYLGRFLRWNSWDAVFNPKPLLMDIADRFLHPFAHMQTWGVTLMIAAFLVSGFLLLQQLVKFSRVKG